MHDDSARQNLENILGGLLLQLMRSQLSHGRITDITKAKYQAWKEEAVLPSVDERLEMLRSQIALLPRVFIVIDALDECPDDPGINVRSDFLHRLKGLPDNTHILYTYRDIGNLSHSITGGRRSVIPRQEISANEEDLSKYFRGRIAEASELRRIIDEGAQAEGNLFQRVLDILIERCKGM